MCDSWKSMVTKRDPNQIKYLTHPQVSGAGEVLSILVEGHGHDPVCGVKRLLHSISMVDINVYVQDSLVVSG